MKKTILALCVLFTAAIPTVAAADPEPPYGCMYVLGKLICVDEPIGP